MNKIKELIDRQLGELPDYPIDEFDYDSMDNNTAYTSIIKAVRNFDGDGLKLISVVLKQEQEKRELLKALIEIERCYELLINCSPMRANVKLIEKHLKMKWKEIIDF